MKENKIYKIEKGMTIAIDRNPIINCDFIASTRNQKQCDWFLSEHAGSFFAIRVDNDWFVINGPFYYPVKRRKSGFSAFPAYVDDEVDESNIHSMMLLPNSALDAIGHLWDIENQCPYRIDYCAHGTTPCECTGEEDIPGCAYLTGVPKYATTIAYHCNGCADGPCTMDYHEYRMRDCAYAKYEEVKLI